MSSDRSSSWFRLVATTVLSLILLGVVVFFGLTRTEVGRDGVRMQLERQFNAQFAGSLHIDRLDGNFVQTLFARDVQVRSPEGHVVAQADSIVLRPTWSALLNRTLALQRIDVHTTHAVAVRTEHGTSLTRAFAPADPQPDRHGHDTESGSASGSSLNLLMPRIHLHDTHITTRNEGTVPDAIASGWLTDFWNSTFHLPDAALNLQWSDAGRYADIELERLHHPDTDLTVDRFSGRLSRTDTGWTLDPTVLTTARSELRVEGTWEQGADADRPFSAAVQADPIDFGEWGSVFPRIPNQEPVTLDAAVRGPLSSLIVETMRVQQAGTTLSVEGTALGFPHDLDIEAALRVDNLTETVAQSWSVDPLPESGPAALPLSGEVYVQGQVRAAQAVNQLAAWRADSASGQTELNVTSAAGDVVAAMDVDWATDAPLAYDGTLTATNLALHEIAPGTIPDITRLTGTLALEGSGTSRSSAIARAEVELSSSILAGGAVEALTGTIGLDRGMLQGTAALTQATGRELMAEWRMSPEGSVTEIETSVETRRFDVSPWAGPWQETTLTGTIDLQARTRASAIEHGTLSINVDTSTVRPHPTEDQPEAAARTIPAHTMHVALDPETGQQAGVPRLVIGGDVLSVSAGGSGWTRPRAALLPAWGRAVAETIAYEHAVEGTAPGEIAAAVESAVEAARPAAPMWRPPDAADGPFSFGGTLRIHRPDVLHAWMPALPQVAGGTHLQANVYAAPDSMNSTIRLNTDALRTGSVRADNLDVELRVGADDADRLPDRLSIFVNGYADQVDTPVASLFEPLVRGSYEERRGSVLFETIERGQTGPIQAEIDLRAFDTRNELVVQYISAEAGDHQWRSVRPSSWTLYSNRVVGAPLELTSDAPLAGDDATQSIVIDGAFSPDKDDALNVEFYNVQLLPLSQLAGWSQPLGGLVNGNLQLSGTWRSPVGGGDLRVDEWSFDRRLLGDLTVGAHYVIGAPDLELDLALAPTPNVEGPADAQQALVPGGIQQVVENQLALAGRLRVSQDAPEWDEDEWIDLQLDIERADLFFFDFVFGDVMRDIEGYTRGSSSITGRWERPVFDADMEVDGAFTIPRFNLAYTLAGPVSVDREGIHLDDAVLEDRDEGRAEIGGSVLFNDYQFFSFDLRSTVDELTIMDVARADDLPFYGFIRASGPLQLQGPLSNTRLVSDDARTSSDTEVYIPVTEGEGDPTSGFLIYADSTSQMLDWEQLTRRANIFADRPEGEASFLDGMEIDLNIQATRGGRLHIVFDALVGDVITTEGTGRVQLQREDGEFSIFGSLDVVGGTYLFTAGEVFVRRFSINQGSLSWDGDPINAELDIEAAFRTRASPAGLPGFSERSARIPVVIDLDITGRVETPEVALSLSLDRDQRDQRIGAQTFDALLNQEERMTEFATSVLLTNTFLLTTENIAGTGSGSGEPGRLADTGGQLAFNSVSQLVSSQLNRYLSEALPNVDINVGVQGETTDDLDIIYGVALRLLDERLIIRGEGVYTSNDELRTQQAGPQGEFAVEVRLSNQVSMEVFYRRAGDDLTRGQTLTSTTGIGLFYQTQFNTWGSLWRRVTGRSESPTEAPPALDPPDVSSEPVITVEEAEDSGVDP